MKQLVNLLQILDSNHPLHHQRYGKFCWQQRTIKANVSHLETIPAFPGPCPAHMHCLPSINYTCLPGFVWNELMPRFHFILLFGAERLLGSNDNRRFKVCVLFAFCMRSIFWFWGIVQTHLGLRFRHCLPLMLLQFPEDDYQISYSAQSRQSV